MGNFKLPLAEKPGRAALVVISFFAGSALEIQAADPYNITSPPKIGRWPDEEAIKKSRQTLNISTTTDIKLGEFYYHAVDINKDGAVDWFVYSLDGCGSRGCEGDVFICRNTISPCQRNDYCYAGSGHQHVLEKPRKDLKCESEYKELNLERR